MSAPPIENSSGGINLNPSVTELLGLNPDWLMLVLLIVVTGAYAWQYWRFRSQPQGTEQGLDWPLWKVALFVVGVVLWFVCTQTNSTTFVRQSMALYMTRLMVLAEIVPPLLIVALPKGIQLSMKTLWGRVLNLVLDPWVSLVLWSAIIIFWNIPAGFNASIVSNTANQLLPMLYLVSSAMVWSVVLRPLPTVQPVTIGSRGWFGLLASLPMMMVAAVWLYSKTVLYTPYVNALCLWNLTPLDNQQISGIIMMVAGLPAMILAVVQILAWLIKLADEAGT